MQGKILSQDSNKVSLSNSSRLVSRHLPTSKDVAISQLRGKQLEAEFLHAS